jgi:hypothetical protein
MHRWAAGSKNPQLLERALHDLADELESQASLINYRQRRNLSIVLDHYADTLGSHIDNRQFA